MSEFVSHETEWGYKKIKFRDTYGKKCLFQETSGAVLLGRSSAIMCLTQEHVRDLLPALQHFSEHGELP